MHTQSQQPQSFLQGMVQGDKIWKMNFLHRYLEEQRQSSKISCLVDFGCANGDVTKNLWAHWRITIIACRQLGMM